MRERHGVKDGFPYFHSFSQLHQPREGSFVPRIRHVYMRLAEGNRRIHHRRRISLLFAHLADFMNRRPEHTELPIVHSEQTRNLAEQPTRRQL